MSMDRRKVYVYHFPGEKAFCALACDCHMHERERDGFRELRFLDPPNRPHMIRGELARENGDGFLFRSEGYKPGEWTFKELTIEEFRREFYRYVEEGETIAQVIHTTDDLHEWYRKEFHFPAED